MSKPYQPWAIEGFSLLSNEHLLECYETALEISLEEAFIQMLKQEMDRRGLSNETYMDKSDK